MQTFDVQSVLIDAPFAKVFAFLSEPVNLSLWASAFTRADNRSARLQTPSGDLEIGLETRAVTAAGTVDWHMTFPGGSIGTAYSRLVPHAGDRTIYSFTLMAPPVPLERLEGALAEQKLTLAKELQALRGLMEHHD